MLGQHYIILTQNWSNVSCLLGCPFHLHSLLVDMHCGTVLNLGYIRYIRSWWANIIPALVQGHSTEHALIRCWTIVCDAVPTLYRRWGVMLLDFCRILGCRSVTLSDTLKTLNPAANKSVVVLIWFEYWKSCWYKKYFSMIFLQFKNWKDSHGY